MTTVPQPFRRAFVVGCVRSGTTWVRSILEGHPLVVTGPESHVFPQLFERLARRRPTPASCAAVLARFDAAALGDGKAGPHLWVDRGTLERLLDECATSDAAPDIAAECLIEGVLDAYFASHGGSAQHVLVEKTPNHLFHAERILRRWPEARIVEVVRDGRDVCVSLEHRARAVSWPPQERSEQIGLWTVAVRHGMELRATPLAAGRWHVVRYERMAADPVGETLRLVEFLDLECSSQLAADLVQATAFATLPGVGPDRHYRKGVVGDWANHFSEDDHALFGRLVGDLFVEAGYQY